VPRDNGLAPLPRIRRALSNREAFGGFVCQKTPSFTTPSPKANQGETIFTCKCGGIVKESEYFRKTEQVTVYGRRCASCGREEKSLDMQKWQSPAEFWKLPVFGPGVWQETFPVN